jgi:hypothetical protein
MRKSVHFYHNFGFHISTSKINYKRKVLLNIKLGAKRRFYGVLVEQTIWPKPNFSESANKKVFRASECWGDVYKFLALLLDQAYQR